MIKDIRVYLDDAIESCDKIAFYLKNITKDKFDKNIELQDAVIRRLAIIGEAIKRLPQSFRDEHSEIEWRKVTGMRDILVHHYDEVSTDQIWLTIRKNLPDFRNKIKNLLQLLED